MFGNKKQPVLTATICRSINMLCQAVEVFIGERVSVACFDFNTGRGKLIVGDITSEVGVDFCRDDLISFRLSHPAVPESFNTALFNGDTVKVINELSPRVKETVAGECILRWVGTSKEDRREEPLFLKDFEYCAKVRGLTLEQLLNTEG